MNTFDFFSNISLENDWVKLIPLETYHLKELAKISNESYIWTYFFEKGNNEKNLKTYIESALRNRKQQKEYPFAIFDKKTNKYAGSTRVYEYSEELKTIKLGHTWYGKKFRGTGLNKQCKYVLFEFLFEKIQIERIGFGVYKGNNVSISALKSVGCQQEGILRGMFPSLDTKGRTDCILLSILKSDWEDKVKTELKNKLV